MVANFMIGVATLLSSSGLTIMGKIVALSFPIICFAALSVQHAPANVGYFTHIFIWKDTFSSVVNVTSSIEMDYLLHDVEWWDAMVWNVIPAGLGNALGGFALAFIFVYTFIK